MVRKYTKHKEHKKGYRHPKTLKGMENLRAMFEKKTDVSKGLLKEEILALYTGTDLSNVLKWKDDKTKKAWSTICLNKKFLRKNKIIAIIGKRMPVGSVLKNEHRTRQLMDKRFVYYRCSGMGDALNYRDLLDKISKGIFKAGEETMEIVEQEAEEIPLLEVINGNEMPQV